MNGASTSSAAPGSEINGSIARLQHLRQHAAVEQRRPSKAALRAVLVVAMVLLHRSHRRIEHLWRAAGASGGASCNLTSTRHQHTARQQWNTSTWDEVLIIGIRTARPTFAA
jgi:hypothetical protein